MPSAKSLRVLVVDDQESIRGVMRNYVKRMGIDNVDAAESGSAALKLYCGPVMRHPAAPLQAANFSSAI